MPKEHCKSLLCRMLPHLDILVFGFLTKRWYLMIEHAYIYDLKSDWSILYIHLNIPLATHRRITECMLPVSIH